MQLSNIKQDDVVICNIVGDIDINSSPDIRKSFEKLVSGKEGKMVINLSKVSYIDSSGLATLVELLKKTKNYGGIMKLSGLTEKVRGLFEITKLEKLFQIYETSENAVSTF